MLMGSQLADIQRERNLGAIVDSSMKILTWCTVIVRKANSVMGIIRKNI